MIISDALETSYGSNTSTSNTNRHNSTKAEHLRLEGELELSFNPPGGSQL
jgi:hypothetical protein